MKVCFFVILARSQVMHGVDLVSFTSLPTTVIYSSKNGSDGTYIIMLQAVVQSMSVHNSKCNMYMEEMACFLLNFDMLILLFLKF